MAEIPNFIEAGAFGLLNDVLSSFHSNNGYAQPNRFEILILPPTKRALPPNSGGVNNVFSGVERPVIAQTFSSEQHYIFQFSYLDILEPQLAITYESRTGISHNEKSITSTWRTSCVANRRVYIGNLKSTYEDGTSKTFPDKMVRSLPNKFDIFPISESVDVAINDGQNHPLDNK